MDKKEFFSTIDYAIENNKDIKSCLASKVFSCIVDNKLRAVMEIDEFSELVEFVHDLFHRVDMSTIFNNCVDNDHGSNYIYSFISHYVTIQGMKTDVNSFFNGRNVYRIFVDWCHRNQDWRFREAVNEIKKENPNFTLPANIDPETFEKIKTYVNDEKEEKFIVIMKMYAK